MSRSSAKKVRKSHIYSRFLDSLSTNLLLSLPGSIFRTRRGIMRGSLFYTNKAEYMTRERFKELGLTPNDVGERDAQFGMKQQQEVEELPEDAVEHVAGLGGKNPFATTLPTGSMSGIGAPQSESEKPAPAMEVEQLAVCLRSFLKRKALWQLANTANSQIAPSSSCNP